MSNARSGRSGPGRGVLFALGVLAGVLLGLVLAWATGDVAGIAGGMTIGTGAGFVLESERAKRFRHR